MFDEADALFGKRGEVKDGYDRCANIEIDDLLRRIEDSARELRPAAEESGSRAVGSSGVRG